VVALFKGTTLVQAGNRKATMSLGTLFTFTVSNGTSLAAGKLEVTPPSGSTNTQFRSTVINDGTEPVVPSGMAVLLDAQGRMVGKTPFGQRRLLPGETATLMAEYPGELARGSYRAVATFDVAGRPLTLVSPLNVP
jgi:archaellum component FlaF (FlaF/FlaG flagellin family)